MNDEGLWIETDGDPLDVQIATTRRSAAKVSTRDGHIGCPLSWFRLVFPLVHGKNELAIALHIYRLRMIRHSRTVTVSNTFLAELGIERHAKYRALQRLAAAGIIAVRYRHKQAPEVTFRDQKR